MEKIRNPLHNGNRLQLGTFATNGRGSAHTVAPDRFLPTWENTLRVAKMADKAGLELLLGIARWKGVVPGDAEHSSGVIFDPFTWSAAIAQATTYSAVFATTHAPTIHPVALAKATATIDHIAGGRFGLNIVGGWNKPEFDMFGITLAEHDERYDYLEEWLGVLRRLWSEETEFDFKGRYLELRGAMSRPQPTQKPGPLIMNAANSGRGRQFACAHADICFVSVGADKAKAREDLASYRKIAREEYGRDVKLWSVAMIVQRDTRQEADDYLHYFSVEHQDRASIDGWMAQMGAEARDLDGKAVDVEAKRAQIAAGGRMVKGTAQDIADGLEESADIGLDGCLLSFNNFEDGIARFERDVLPIMERRGLRAPHPDTAEALRKEVA